MHTTWKILTTGLMMGNMLAAQIATTIVTTTTIAPVPLVFPNCTTPNFAVPAKPKDTKRFVLGDQVKEGTSLKQIHGIKESRTAVYDGVGAWSLSTGSEIQRVDMTTGKVVESHFVLDAVAFLLDGDTLWVGTSNAQLHRYSRSSRKILSTIVLGSGPIIKIATDGSSIVAVSNGLVVLSSYTMYRGMMTVVKADGTYLTIGLNSAQNPYGPYPLSFTIEGGYVWITNSIGEIVRIPVSLSGEPPQKYSVDTDAGKIVDVTSDGASLWFVNEASGNVSRFDMQSKTVVSKVPGAPGAKKLLFDGTSLWVATTDRVVQFHGTDSRKLGEMQIGTQPTALFFDGMKVWLADRYSASLKQVQ